MSRRWRWLTAAIFAALLLVPTVGITLRSLPDSGPTPERPASPPTPGATDVTAGPPVLPPPASADVPSEAICIFVSASGATEIDADGVDAAEILSRLRDRAARSRDPQGVSLESMVVVADPDAPWRAVRDVLSLCSHPDVRVERVFLEAVGGATIRLVVPRFLLVPRGENDRLEVPPRIGVGLERNEGRTTVRLLDRTLGTGDGAFSECDRSIGGILGQSPALMGEIRAANETPLRDVLRVHAMFGRRGADALFYRVPAACWKLEEFLRDVEARQGSEARRALVRGLERADFRVANEAAYRLAELWEIGRDREDLLAEIGEALRSDSDRLRTEILHALEIFAEPEALGPLIPDLLTLRNRNIVSGTAQRVDFLLEKIGAPVAEYYARMARESTNPQTRAYAVRYLAGLAGHAAARTALREALADRDGVVRAAAAAEFVKLGVETSRAFEVLGRDMRAGEREAVIALIRLGDKAAPAVPDLVAGLSHRDADFRRWIVYALDKIGPERPEVRAILERIAADEDEAPAVRLAARTALRD